MAREMKNSGIEWIGEIPAEWICDKVCRQFALIGSGTTPKSDNDSNYIGNIHWIQSGDINGGILHNTKNKVSNEVVEKYSALKVYKSPFIVIAMYGASIGNISSSIIDGCVNQACCVLSEGHMNIKYAFYTLKSAKDYLIYNGVGGGQPNISQDIVKQLRLPVPSIREQEMIADYLDKKCAEIDAVIEKTKATIEEYKKLKQSVITEAVTKGIRGDRPMKDSGVEWIDSIPAGWDISRTKVLFSFGKGLPITKDNLIETGVSVISYGQIHSKTNNGTTLSEDLFRFVSEDYLISNASALVHKDDFIVADTSEDLDGCGNCAFVDTEMLLFAGYHTIILHSNTEGDNKYFAYLFRTDAWRSQIRSKVSGVKLFSISKKILSDTTLLIPSCEERCEIVKYLNNKCAEIDTLISKKTALLEEMESYKKSVIYEYVTGKKEVKTI